MNNALLYQLSMGVCGGFFALIGLYSLRAGEVHATTVLFAVAGIGMVVNAAYEATLSSDPHAPGDRTVQFIALCAATVIVATTYSAFG